MMDRKTTRVYQFKQCGDSDANKICESENEADEPETLTSYEYFFTNIKCMNHFSNSKDDGFLNFLIPMRAMIEDVSFVEKW
jgi:hypothetical protein